MKYILVLLTAFSFAMTDANAQKFGHINTALLIDTLEETKAAYLEIEDLTKQIQDQITAKENALVAKETEITEAQARGEGEFTLRSMYNDFQTLQQSYENLVRTGEQTLQARQAELIAPINEMAREAIKQVGEENGYTYIFDLATGGVIFESGDDVMALVLAKIDELRAQAASESAGE